jgi:hypothetical protein
VHASPRRDSTREAFSLQCLRRDNIRTLRESRRWQVKLQIHRKYQRPESQRHSIAFSPATMTRNERPSGAEHHLIKDGKLGKNVNFRFCIRSGLDTADLSQWPPPLRPRRLCQSDKGLGIEKTGPTPVCGRARRPFLLEIEAHS